MTPQLGQVDADEQEKEEDQGDVNPYQSAADAKAKVIQLRDRALDHWHKDEWECIMNMYTNEGFFDTLLCWIRPTRDFLSFLHAELRRLQVTRIVSVGCGCGFLEWLIKRACSGIEVVGYEVDRAWWQGRYGVKPFIEHIYIDEVKTRHVPEGSVLMTCYFHSWEGWRQYLAEFRGDVVIVIGPHTNDHLTFPEPRHLLTDPRFVLESQREIDGGDIVVVMRRDPEIWPVPPPPPVPASGPEPLPSVKPPDDKAEQAKRYSEMRRSFVMDRICNAKQHPKTAPPDPTVRQGPALQSTYKTRKPSLAFSLGSFSVASRLKSMGGSEPAGGMKRSVSASARLETVGLSSESKPRRKRSSRSVPSLAPLSERTEDEQVWQRCENEQRRPSAEQGQLDSEMGRGRRGSNLRESSDQHRRNSLRRDSGASSRHEENGQSAEQTLRRRNSAHKAIRQQPKREQDEPNREHARRPDAQSELRATKHEPRRSRAAAARPSSPPLVTVTDLSSERRRSLRGPGWPLRPDGSPSR
ncbi:uncharacterized protein LOC119108918 [Pollicipes pollicipes]|uniref:uncharacterized protein LOC119108918 n=1 Tax=Pollicipes pollicipes TaxID=41117 RepID=UPI001885835F|nr:uncharacterized protein LOC119108918 [Pollicipes pollicipes]